MRISCMFLAIIWSITSCLARKHHLSIQDDARQWIPLSSFGFYPGGYLEVQISNFHIENGLENSVFGLSLDRTVSDAMNPYLDISHTQCLLHESAYAESADGKPLPIIYFVMDLKSKKLLINSTKNWSNIRISSDGKEVLEKDVDGEQMNTFTPIDISSGKDDIYNVYGFNFTVFVDSKMQEGLYNLFFHNCPAYKTAEYHISFNAFIEESNAGNYLSAGEIPLPGLYFMMATIFFLTGIFWVAMLRTSKNPVFKIHYVMAALVFLKALSLMFHAINYHFIQVRGEPVETWAVLYYITHLIKGAVLFVTIILIGTGWTFIKHILADKDKKLFMIVIPLQVVANVAEIIIAESEEGDKEHSTWRDIFILVDLLCCGCILFPVVWSIRHLQAASATDGKAAINLTKLKLFRQFYIMIVCYIYFTRIIVYLLKITVAFQYSWLDELFREMATFVFFVLTGYKFRPVPQHPYFTMGQDDSDDEVEILTQSGVTEGLSKLTNRTQNLTIVEHHDEEERENLLSEKKESSHEYD